ncbi:MAG: hypothetical protein Q4D32_00720 [Eubacteriales bacterium]|nr:hypothetical protein [Eubacteriales bacterium]
MKTVFRRFVAVCMAMALAAGSLSVAQTADAKSKGYIFKYKGVSVSADSAAKKLIKKAGKPQKKQVKKSCAYDGKDRIYQYKNFWLTTYSKTNNGPEYVQQIKFRNAKVKTKEGIKIGSKEATVVKKYGKGYDKADLLINSAYVYKKGNCTLKINVKDGKVSGITYLQTTVKK